jgi:site-specific recombinase XerD
MAGAGAHMDVRQLTYLPPSIHEAPVGQADPPAKPRDLQEAIDTYCACLTDASRAPHTVRSTELDLRGLLEHLGDVALGDLTPRQLAAHVRWLRTERRNGSASLRRKIATFKTFFRHAVAAGWITDSPAESLPYPALTRPPIVTLESHELEAVLAAGAHDRAWHALALLLADAGLKRDEVLALEAEDLYLAADPSDSRVTVRHSSQAKRVRRRSVPLTPRAHFALARLLSAPLPGGPLFSISIRGVNFVVETIGRRAGISRLKKLTPEILRDTFAVHAMAALMREETAAAERGATPRELDRLRVGHDVQVLQALGVSRYSDMAGRYRAAVPTIASSDPQTPRGPAPAIAESAPEQPHRHASEQPAP